MTNREWIEKWKPLALAKFIVANYYRENLGCVVDWVSGKAHECHEDPNLRCTQCFDLWLEEEHEDD